MHDTINVKVVRRVNDALVVRENSVEKWVKKINNIRHFLRAASHWRRNQKRSRSRKRKEP